MPKIWYSPNVASRDLLQMFQSPELWSKALEKIDVFQFVQWSITTNANPQAGPNILPAFLTAVPGGVFKWLGDRGIDIAIEAGSVKEWSCGERRHAAVDASMQTLGHIFDNGGVVKYIEMDEPFVRGLEAPPGGCGYTVQQTAGEVRLYVDAIRGAYPGVEVGLVEAYPVHNGQQIVGFVQALEQAGVHLPFLHIDVDLYRVKREKALNQLKSDLRLMKEFCNQRGIPFGVVIWGEHGESNTAFALDATNMALIVNEAIGFMSQDELLFQSWSTVGGQFLYPDNLAETNPTTLTGILNVVLSRFGG